MGDGKPERNDTEALRADPSSEQGPSRPACSSPEATCPHVHDLQVYQAELETQNEELRRVQRELVEVRDRYVDLYDQAPMGYLTLDERGRLVEANLTAALMLGVERSRLIGRYLLAYVAKEYLAAFSAILRRVRETGLSATCELRMKTRDGVSPWVLLECAPNRVERPGQRIRVVLSDVSARRHAQDALVESRRKLSNAVRIAKLGYWEYDIASDLFTFDDDFYAIFGATAAQVGGYTMSPAQYAQRFVHPADAHVVFDEVRTTIESDPSLTERQFEHRMVYADGRTGHIAVHFLIVRDEHGRAVRTYGANQDITQRKEAEEELRSQRDFSESLIETAPAIVLVLDSQGRIVRFNPYLEELSGYTLAEVQGRAWFDTFVPDRIRDEVQGIFATAIGNVPTRGYINPILTKDGRERLIEWHDKTLKDASGCAVGVIAIGRDITERQQAEQALRRARDELEMRVAERTQELAAANELLRMEMAERHRSESRQRQLQADLAHVGRLTTMGEMASGLAHELNQPLAAIVLQSEVIARMAAENAGTFPPELLHALDFITRQSHRAGELIRRMRGFVRHAAPKRAVVTMSEVVDEVLPLVERDLRAARVALEVRIDDPPVEIQADKVQLQQVLLNLVRNGIEAMENTDAGCRRLCIARCVRGQTVEVTVQDTGQGIAAADADKLFKTFYSTKAEGMGMGLAICRSIIESHGGRIWATPNPDQGTTFTFTLPIATEGEDNGSKTSRLSCG